jgi:hypothetical protein
MTAVGDLLTDERADSTGKIAAPVDSKYFLNSMGASTGKLPVPERLSSAYKVVNSPIYKAADAAGDATKSECNVIESPGAMYTATAVDAAATLYSGPYGILKVIGSFALDPIISYAISKVAEFGLQAIVDQLVEDDFISQAQGEELGDIIGVGATAFFAAGSMSRLLPASSVANRASFKAVKQENEAFQQQMAVAALSPFDTSSRYTFLGSILYNIRSGMLINGYYNNSFSSILSTVANLPSLALSIPTASAEMYSSDYCDYAGEYGMDTDDPETTPAINVAGLPCTGITEDQANMEVDEAIDAMVDEGWVDETKAVEENATISDLVTSGVIVADTPLAEYIDSCGDASTGSSFIDSSSCIMNPAEGGDLSVLDDQASNDCIDDVCYSDAGVESDVTGPEDPESIAAIPVFLLDYQINAAINGEDPEEAGDINSTGEDSSSNSGITGEVDPNGWASPVQSITISSPYGYRSSPISGSGEFHDGVDLSGSSGSAIFAVRDGTVTAAVTGCVAGDTQCGGRWGNWIAIDHGEVSGIGHIYSFYAHLESVGVSIGDTVSAGQQIGTMGTTGSSTGTHLHFGIYNTTPGVSDSNGSTTYNPTQVVPQLGGSG